LLDHLSLRVADYSRSKNFYLAALAPLGFSLAMETSAGAGFRKGFIPCFWVKTGMPHVPVSVLDEAVMPGCGGAAIHVAFTADSREAVDSFYRAAVAAGGRSNGAPDLRPEYHPNYYSAFVLDPDGYNVEAVYHRPV
jgi:catechol 2,3-dioxygenase-like lactoylglutathione lyase family enzyme